MGKSESKDSKVVGERKKIRRGEEKQEEMTVERRKEGAVASSSRALLVVVVVMMVGVCVEFFFGGVEGFQNKGKVTSFIIIFSPFQCILSGSRW